MVTVKDPACTSPGKKEGKCTRCGTVVTSADISPTGHSFGSWAAIKYATCSESGIESRTCSQCQTRESQTIAAFGHQFNGVMVTVKDPACTSPGKKEGKCTRCGGVVTSADISPTGHSFGSWAAIKYATCTESGIESRTCSQCPSRESQAIAAFGHEFNGIMATVLEPTCSSLGKKEGNCTRCGAVVTSVDISPTDHSFGSWTAIKHATCAESGIESRTCSQCPSRESQAITAFGHEFNGIMTTVLEPTCISHGKKEGKCTRCEAVVTSVDIPLTGHPFSWKTIQNATCTNKGIEEGVCDVCKVKETHTIEATGHQFNGNFITVKEPTTDEDGLKEGHCTYCNTVVSTSNIPKLVINDEGSVEDEFTANLTFAHSEADRISNARSSVSAAETIINEYYNKVISSSKYHQIVNSVNFLQKLPLELIFLKTNPEYIKFNIARNMGLPFEFSVDFLQHNANGEEALTGIDFTCLARNQFLKNGDYEKAEIIAERIEWFLKFGTISGFSETLAGLIVSMIKEDIQNGARQVVLGNYCDKVTMSGTTCQVLTGLFGVDLPGDIRDITYDVSHWEWSTEHGTQFGTDMISILPVIGIIKYADEAKTLSKVFEAGSDEAKTLINSVRVAGDVAKSLSNDAVLTDEAILAMKKHIILPKEGYQALLERKYLEIKKAGLTDSKKVAENTIKEGEHLGDYEDKIKAMKMHLFFNIYDLSDEGKPLEKFYIQAEGNIAYAWQTAQTRKLNPEEIAWFRELMNHELKEMELMKGELPMRDPSTWNGNRFNTDIGKNAHDLANETAVCPKDFPTYKQDEEFYANVNKKIYY
jgi:hypothetical protein